MNHIVIEHDLQCLIVGLGKTKKLPSVYPLILQKAPQRYQKARIPSMRKYQQNHQLFHTVGDNGESGCNGDSGGPLFCDINGEMKQFGVASYAHKKCDKLTGWWSPGHVINWIKTNSNYQPLFPIKWLTNIFN